MAYGSKITEAIQKRLEEDAYLSGNRNPNTGEYEADGLVSLYWFYDNFNKVYRKKPAIFVKDEIPVDPDQSSNPQSWKTYNGAGQALEIFRYIYSPGPLADTSFSIASSKQRKARDITRDIYCFAREDGWNISSEGDWCEEMAERIFALFHDKPLVIEPFGDEPHHYDSKTEGYPDRLRRDHLTEWQSVFVKCSGPIDVPQEKKNPFDPSIRGMIVTLNLTVIET